MYYCFMLLKNKTICNLANKFEHLIDSFENKFDYVTSRERDPKGCPS